MQMRRILLFTAWPALQYFSTLFHKCNDFEKKKVIADKMCVLIFSTNFVWNISHSKKNSVRYNQKCILVFMLSIRYSCTIIMKLEFRRQICEESQISNFMKIRPVEAE
jgi:hypothetical protein